MKNFFNLKVKDIAIIVLIVVILIGGGISFKREGDWKTKYNLEVNLKNALTDSIKTYQNKEGEWVTEKLTLQAKINTLEDDNSILSKNQIELIKRIKKISKDKDIFAAVLAQQEVIIDSLINSVVVIDTINNTVKFEANTDTLKYIIKVLHVKPIEIVSPILVLDLKVPNKLFIEFHWEKDKTHPVALSVTNTNSMFKINDVDSFVIPEINRVDLKPKFWKKIKQSKITKSAIFILGVGVGIFIAK